MLKYKHLESTKYWEAKANAEVVAHRKERDRDAIRSFLLFLAFLGATVGFTYALQNGLFADLETGPIVDQAKQLMGRWFG